MPTSPSGLLKAERDAMETNVRWPAEWEPHAATWIAWPHNLQTWPNRFEKIPSIFERKIRTLAEVEKVHVLGGPPDAFREAESLFRDCSNVEVHRIDTNDCWIRDYGPTFVIDRDSNKLVAIDWKFNAWGGKYFPHDLDAAAAIRMANASIASEFLHA